MGMSRCQLSLCVLMASDKRPVLSRDVCAMQKIRTVELDGKVIKLQIVSAHRAQLAACSTFTLCMFASLLAVVHT